MRQGYRQRPAAPIPRLGDPPPSSGGAHAVFRHRKCALLLRSWGGRPSLYLALTSPWVETRPEQEDHGGGETCGRQAVAGGLVVVWRGDAAKIHEAAFAISDRARALRWPGVVHQRSAAGGLRNISDADVLADIAVAHGFEREEARTIARDPEQHRRVEQEAARSMAAGVRSVPHFVFGGRIAINGGRSEDEITSAIREAASAAASA